MRSNTFLTFCAAATCLGLAGCAADGSNLLTTASVTPAKKQVVAAVDPACLALQNRIDILREEGTIGRVEKAASGKTKTVVIKREALSKVAEFNQANAEFRQRCSKLPKPQTAAVAAPKPSVPVTTAAVKPKPAVPQAAVTPVQARTAASQAATTTRQ